MKTITKLSAVAILLFMAACTKMQEVVLTNASLAGTWKLDATYSDPGDGSGKYHPVEIAGTNAITFKPDGKIETIGLNDSENYLMHFSQYTTFAIKDSTTLIFKEPTDTTSQKYLYKIVGDKLTLIPAGPVMCIEGCGTRFEKQK